MIYFIGCALTDRVKIGFTDDVRSRLSQLQVASPTKLSLLAQAEGDRAAEAALHERFADYRLHGEWFARIGELAAYIAELPAAQPQRSRRERPAKTPLDGWMNENDVLNRELAVRLGVCESFVSHLRNGIRQPLLPTLVKLVEITGLPHDAFLQKAA